MSCAVQRSRTVVFRLTQEEYDRLKSAAEVSGARNLSDHTRSELFDAERDRALGAVVQQGFDEINRKLGELSELVRMIAFSSQDGWAAGGHERAGWAPTPPQR